MVLVDAFSNMSMSLIFLLSFPKRVFYNKSICLVIGIIRAYVGVTNRFHLIIKLILKLCEKIRLNPLVVILYRVLMVCHSDFCRNFGEKKIRRYLLTYVQQSYQRWRFLKLFFKIQLCDSNSSYFALRILRSEPSKAGG